MSKTDWVAAVCGAEVRIYGAEEENGRRPLKQIRTFSHYGAARLYAQDYEDSQKETKKN